MKTAVSELKLLWIGLAGAWLLFALVGCSGDKGNPAADKTSAGKGDDASQPANITSAKTDSQSTSSPGASTPAMAASTEKKVPPPTFVGVMPYETFYPDKKVKVHRTVKRYSDDSFIDDGLYTEYYPNGQKLLEGNYIDGKKDGAWHMWWDNGQEAKVENYVAGQLDGQWTVYTPQGLKDSDVSFKAGKRDGRWVTYAADGKQLKEQTDYHEGKPDGASVAWNADGKKISEVHFAHGQLDGVQQQWFPNGQLQVQKEFKGGKLNGKAIQWNDKGEKLQEQDFADGKPVKQPAAKGG
ncbi:MAG TPA: toxin-antitoxin system YwqK family antitoxin [Pirellulales bacterium]|nr:toxin-antitoxin system YwqK family antitoxin [Pirellulales bacterium]